MNYGCGSGRLNQLMSVKEVGPGHPLVCAHHYLYSHLVYSVNALFLWTNRHLIAALVDIMQVVFSAEEISLYAL